MSPAASEECYAFASFRLYPKQRTLARDGELVEIGGRAFDILLLLVSRGGAVVSAGELMCFVWPNVHVDQANLRVQMGLVRKVLSQCAQAERAIETVPLRGYCFILPVQHHLPNSEIEEGRFVPQTHIGLPTLLNPIVGREEATEIVLTALDNSRLVTITGPGGIGKTAVAIATAHLYAAKFAGVITFVDLSRVTDGAQAASAIARALGVEAQGDPLAVLCEHLLHQDLLLILDTCEHIVDPIATLAETLLSRCTRLKLLVTSREALRSAGEWIHRLPSLTFPAEGEEINEENMATFSAITLFVDRVRLSVRFEVQPQDLPVLAEICRRLDGIPLALEFAAARVADLGLHQIVSHLDDRFEILTRGRRTALPRHRTLSAALDWSYSLLSGDEQRMLRYLATLGRSFAAERAIAGGGDIGCEHPPETLVSLYEKSLISVDTSNDVPIYHLLDTTKAYVASRPVA